MFTWARCLAVCCRQSKKRSILRDACSLDKPTERARRQDMAVVKTEDSNDTNYIVIYISQSMTHIINSSCMCFGIIYIYISFFVSLSLSLFLSV